MPVNKLILVKHSLPAIRPEVSAHEWHLSEEGIWRSELLAARLQPYSPGLLFTSAEPKAMQTAEIVARSLKLPLKIMPVLHEHSRRAADYGEKSVFEERVRRLYEQPGNLVFGEETALEAQQRFSSAVHDIIALSPGQTIVVVAHGTVITLFTSTLSGLEPFSFWKRLDLPSFVVFSLPNLELIEVVESVLPQ